MPDIANHVQARRLSLLSVSPAYAPGAEGTPSLPARLLATLDRMLDAARARIAEIVDAEIRLEVLSESFVRCELCGVIHHRDEACDAEAVGHCANCGRDRLVEAERCTKCTSKSVTITRQLRTFRGGRA